jgi:hypothetical protein
MKGGKKKKSISANGGDIITFIAEDAEYISAVVSVKYPTEVSPSPKDTSSACNICFILADGKLTWQVTGTYAQGDNTTIFTSGKMSEGDPTQHHSTILDVIVPTHENNPNVAPSAAKVLQKSQVFVVDWNSTEKTLLVRGNSPLGPKTKGGGQLINFQNLQDAISAACTAANISPDFSTYELYDVAFLSKAEEYIWADEYYSFGGKEDAPNTTEQWVPATLFNLPGLSNSTAKGTWSRWNIEPASDGTILEAMVKMLKAGMSANSSVNLKIYYIHCASGHDRTGMASACYLASTALDALGSEASSKDIDKAVNKAYVMGTTLQKQPITGGDIVATCYDWTSDDKSLTKSRCFPVESAGYTKSLMKALALLNSNNSPYSLTNTKATDKTPTGEITPKSYVMKDYPFKG